MIAIRRSAERGHLDHGWLDTYHTFSFALYYDPEHMGFRSLRVINDDTIQGRRGFGTHGHRDMEIITYVLEGALAHRDSTGGGGVLGPGDVQYMSAGTGVRHSEFSDSDQPTRLLQIWIEPEREGLPPAYSQTNFPDAEKRNRLRLIVGKPATNGALPIHQDAMVFASVLEEGKSVTYEPGEGRYAWLQVATGAVKVNGQLLNTGDGAAITKETKLEIVGAADEDSEFLLFDLA